MLAFAAQQEGELAQKLIENALEDCVSSFDGFGREICRVHASRSSDPAKAASMSFQNLSGARTNVLACFGFDLAQSLLPTDWEAAARAFQKRHLVSHKMGIIDADYIARANDPAAVLGRKVQIDPTEVAGLVEILGQVGESLSQHIASLGASASTGSDEL